jgi:hypothetical protein
MSNTITRSTAAATAALGLSLFLLAACGSGSGNGVKDEGDAHVASIDSPSASGAKSTVSAGSEDGAQIRLDMTDDEEMAVIQAYTHCLKDQGVPSYSKAKGIVFPSGTADKYPAQFKACESKKPIQPPELDPHKNPHYMDQYREWIRCMNDRGFAVDPLPDGSGWNYSDRPGRVDPASSQSRRIEWDCRLEAFGGGK